MAKRRNKPKYVDIVRKGGTEYLYFRKGKGARVPLRGPLDSVEFWADWNAAAEGYVHTRERADRHSLRWLVDQYYRWPAFRELKASTQTVRRRILEGFCKEYGNRGYATLTSQAARGIRNMKQDTPAAGNNLIKALKQVFSEAVEHGIISSNPFDGIRKLKERKQGATPWSIEDVEKYENHHAIGTQARLALALFLYTGQRRSDVARMGRQHIKRETLSMTQTKTGNQIDIPVLPMLREVLDATETGDLTFLITTHGKSFTVNGLGNKFRQWCDEAGLPDKSSHGLRKAMAIRLAEKGCTPHQIGAITGHESLAEIERYTRGANRKKLAENVTRLFSDD